MASNKQHVSLWRNPDYLLLWSGQTISTIGTGVSTIAYPLLVLMVTGSPAQAGFISALRTACAVTLSTLAWSDYCPTLFHHAILQHGLYQLSTGTDT